MRCVECIELPLLGAEGFDERVPASFVAGEARGVDETADVRDPALDRVHAEVTAGEGVEIDGVVPRRRRDVVASARAERLRK